MSQKPSMWRKSVEYIKLINKCNIRILMFIILNQMWTFVNVDTKDIPLPIKTRL
jgi:hypothetical protein